jgi:polyhydroxybutyrate depolymerase
MRLTFFVTALAALAACSSNTATPAPTDPPTLEQAPISHDAAAPDAALPQDAAPPIAISKGCSVAPANVGAVTKRSTTAAGKARSYHLSVPAGLAPKKPAALVFTLHGASDTTPANMRDWFAVESQMPGALFVYPQALPRTRKDGSGGLVTRWHLYGNEDTAFFDAILAELANDYCVDRAHVFVTGFSSGGNFSQQLACLRQKDVKGMAVVAGPGPYSDACGGAVPTWMTHDQDDDTLPVADARSSRDFWASQNGCAKSTWSAVPGRPECQRNPTCAAAAPLVYCETSGVGHQVPDYAATAIGAFFNELRK